MVCVLPDGQAVKILLTAEKTLLNYTYHEAWELKTYWL